MKSVPSRWSVRKISQHAARVRDHAYMSYLQSVLDSNGIPYIDKSEYTKGPEVSIVNLESYEADVIPGIGINNNDSSNEFSLVISRRLCPESPSSTGDGGHLNETDISSSSHKPISNAREVANTVQAEYEKASLQVRKQLASAPQPAVARLTGSNDSQAPLKVGSSETSLSSFQVPSKVGSPALQKWRQAAQADLKDGMLVRTKKDFKSDWYPMPAYAGVVPTLVDRRERYEPGSAWAWAVRFQDGVLAALASDLEVLDTSP